MANAKTQLLSMYKFVLSISLICSTLFVQAQQSENAYKFSVDLTKVFKDQLTVELTPPQLTADTVLYRFPAMVPGTYKVYNFGRFITDFVALDAAGNELSYVKPDRNSFQIADAKKIKKIRYKVEDTWDTDKRADFVFEPAGTNIQKDTNYVLNNHGFFGYFEGMTKVQYEVKVKHPEGMYGSTGLNNVKREGNEDTYYVNNYHDLVDGPIMYCKPDTTWLSVGGTKVLISVYSPKKLVSSKFVADSLRDILEYQRLYLGGTLPVSNYAFIIYLTGNEDGFKSGSYGALEHSYSSMYTLLEMEPGEIAQTVKDVAAHEFFHIVTPLNIHSYEIGDFDFNKPKMSMHLWMYEGLTEYAAHHVQVKYGKMSLNSFIDVLSEKMNIADRYNDTLPFTRMSLLCLDEHEKEYGNVYQKGALIGMCLDIQLRHLSKGQYGTQELMADLSKKYGKDRSFNDDSLITEIVRLTYPEIGEFFKKYVMGNEPIPYGKYLEMVGLNYEATRTEMVLDPLGGYFFIQDNQGNVRIYSPEPNSFGNDIGYKNFDVIKSINGKKVTPQNMEQVLGELKQMKEGTKLKIKIIRGGIFGMPKQKMTLKGTLRKSEKVTRHIITVDKGASETQLLLRKFWINK